MGNKTKQKAFACSVLVVVTAGIGYSFWQGVRHRPEARREMRDFMARAQPGDTKAEVRRIFAAGSYEALSLRDERGADLWTITTPAEFGAGNWILLLEFEEDEVRALRLRIADGITTRPREPAPPDEIGSGWPWEFPRN